MVEYVLLVCPCIQLQSTFMLQAFHMKLDFDNEDSVHAAKERSFNVNVALFN